MPPSEPHWRTMERQCRYKGYNVLVKQPALIRESSYEVLDGRQVIASGWVATIEDAQRVAINFIDEREKENA